MPWRAACAASRLPSRGPAVSTDAWIAWAVAWKVA
jgi:hypothetical protein